MKTIFIDGYNVINSWPNLIEIKNYNLDLARQKLIEIMENYAEYKGYRIFIVFDGHMVKGNIEKKDKVGNLTIVFTKYGETADSYIERSVNNIGRRSDVSVVTSDSLEQQLVFQRGAIRKSSIEFYHEINQVNNRLRKKIKKKACEDKNLLEDLINKDVLEKLEKIRRSR